MCAEKYESQLRTLQQKAKSDAAERHPAAVLSTHQAHKIEQVPLGPPLDLSQNI